MLDPRIRALFAGPNFAHLATIMPDGSPHSAPIWIGVEGDDLVFHRTDTALGMRNLRRDERLAISIHNMEDPYECAYVRGGVKELREGEVAEQWVDDIAVTYTGKPYPPPIPSPSTVVVVEVEQAGYGHFTNVEHTPPGAGVQLPRARVGDA